MRFQEIQVWYRLGGWRRAVVALPIALALSLAGAAHVQAQDWPTEPLTMVIPFDAGGSIDRLGRGLAPLLSEELGVDVRVENRPGASGQIGFTQVFSGPADGSVFVVAPEPYLSNSILKSSAPYKLEDWAIMAVQENDPVSLTVLQSAPYDDLGDLIEAIRANPNTVRAGVSASSAPQLQLIAMREELGELPYREITYDGTAYRNALLGGHVDFIMSSASGDLPMKDQVKVLAVASEEPFPGWEGAKSFNAQLEPYGVKVPNIGAIRFVAFPAEFKQNYPERWETFKEAYSAAVNSPAYQEQIERTGQSVVTRKDPFLNAEQIMQDNFQAIRDFGN